MEVLYSAPFDNVSVTLATDIFHGTVIADEAVKLVGMTISQAGTSDVGEAQEEFLRLGLYRGVTGGSGGTGLTEVAYQNSALPAPSTVILCNNTTASTGGTLLDVVGFNVRVPAMWLPLPDMRPRIDSAEDPFSWRLMAAPADAITLSGVLFWREG